MAVRYFNLAETMGQVDAARANDQRIKLNQLLMDRQQRQFDREDRAYAQENALKEAYKNSIGADGSFDNNVLLKNIGQVAPMQAYALSQDIKKQGREDETYDLQKQKAELGLLADKAARTKDVLATLTPETYIPQMQALMQDPDTAKALEGAPQEYDAAWIRANIQDAESFIQDARVKAQQEFTAGENEKSRAVTIRGQNITAENARQNRALQRELTQKRIDATNQTGKAPSGYQFNATGGLEPIPGSKQALEAEQAAKKLKASQEATVAKASVILNKVNEAKNKINFFTTGVTGAVAGKIPATDRKALESALETIKANLGFQELQEMRANSPTGGALGQVAVQELVALQSTVANLSPDLPPKTLKANLDEIAAKYSKIANAVKQDLGKSAGATPSSNVMKEADAILGL